MAAVVGNSLLNIARACAQEIGPYILTATTGTSSSATNLSLAQNQMIDSEAEPERYGGWYAYLASGTYAGQQARIRRDGFDGATGATTLANPINTSGGVQVASGVAVELHGAMPRISADGLVGIRECVNRMARKLWTRYRYPFTGVTGQGTYDLGSLYWLDRRRVIRLLDPDPAGTGHPPVAGQSWDVVRSGENWELQLGGGYTTGDVFWLEVEMPLNARMYISGAWANQASPVAGLVLDADALLGDWNHVFQCSLYECYAALAVQAGGARKSYWAERKAEQAAVVAQIKLYEMSDDTSLGEGPTDSPGSWSDVGHDKGFWSL